MTEPTQEQIESAEAELDTETALFNAAGDELFDKEAEEREALTWAIFNGPSDRDALARWLVDQGFRRSQPAPRTDAALREALIDAIDCALNDAEEALKPAVGPIAAAVLDAIAHASEPASDLNVGTGDASGVAPRTVSAAEVVLARRVADGRMYRPGASVHSWGDDFLLALGITVEAPRG